MKATSLNACVEAIDLTDSELAKVSGGNLVVAILVEVAIDLIIAGLDYAVNETGEPSNPAYMNSGNYLQMGGYNSYGGYSN